VWGGFPIAVPARDLTCIIDPNGCRFVGALNRGIRAVKFPLASLIKPDWMPSPLLSWYLPTTVPEALIAEGCVSIPPGGAKLMILSVAAAAGIAISRARAVSRAIFKA